MTSAPVRLLVSVRSAAEADDALTGGADLIDIKEPYNGPLGRPSLSVVNAVLDTVAAQAPVSIALGELSQITDITIPHAISYAKFGLADVSPNWQSHADRLCDILTPARIVITAYADHQRANSPPVHEVAAYVTRRRVAGFLIDTAVKDTTNLFDWIHPDQLRHTLQHVAAAGPLTALAGSLNGAALTTALSLAPDIIAVRGAACHQGQRLTRVDPDRVRQLAVQISTHTPHVASHAG